MRFLTSAVNGMKLPHHQRRMLIASRIKDARLNNGLSQRDAAEALHIGQSTYCRIEKGQTEPSVVQIVTLSGLYDVSVLWLMGYPSFIAKIN